MLRRSLWSLVCLLVITTFVFVGCNKQAQSSSEVKTDAKCSLAQPEKTVKTCPAMAEKKCSPEMAKKCAADPNMMKNCPMKTKKCCLMMKNKKACCAKKVNKCKGADANAPVKQ